MPYDDFSKKPFIINGREYKHFCLMTEKERDAIPEEDRELVKAHSVPHFSCIDDFSIDSLKGYAESFYVKGYEKMNRQQLIEAVREEFQKKYVRDELKKIGVRYEGK